MRRCHLERAAECGARESEETSCPDTDSCQDRAGTEGKDGPLLSDTGHRTDPGPEGKDGPAQDRPQDRGQRRTGTGQPDDECKDRPAQGQTPEWKPKTTSTGQISRWKAMRDRHRTDPGIKGKDGPSLIVQQLVFVASFNEKSGGPID
ncbi:hypothetical protein WMY93_002917 [Mugilogobius chulae]|uniref:Uncharacterized protein n=1 Tax=Mugilogobius chulae TaxID=88201 RepID=A0AAW0QAA1_9GOBI